MNKRKVISIIVALVIVTLVIFSIIIILLIKTNMKELDSTDYNLNTEFEKMDIYEVNAKIELLNNRNKYYAVKNILTMYMEYINQINSTEDEKIKNMFLEEIYNILDINYIKDSNMNKDALYDIISKYNKDEEIRIEDVYLLEKSSSINIYIIYARHMKENAEHMILIKTDSLNSTYSIFFEDYIEKYDISEKSENIEINADSIEENKSNKFRYANISDEQMALNYFQDLRWLILNDSKGLYNKLDEKYKKAKFKTDEEYMSYIENLKDIILRRKVDKYQIKEYGDYKQYVCMDQKGRYYIFRENAIMEYTLLLDTYTVDLPEFLEKYNKASENEKLGMNIEKVLEAVNNKDYKYVYEKLNKTFRDNNFSDINNFEKYIKSKFFNISDIEYKSYKQQGNTYVYNINIKDVENENNIKEFNIIIKLKDGTDFEISFAI